jgi:hypothetical protein
MNGKKKTKKGWVPKSYEVGGLEGGIMPPDQFLLLDPAAQQTYLDTLSPSDKAAMTQAVADHRNSANPVTPKLPMTPSEVTPVTPRKPISIPGITPPPAERLDVEAGIKSIQPNVPAAKNTGQGKELVNNVLDRLGTTAGVAATITDIANLSDPSNTSVGVGAASGAVKGAVAGAGAGPLGIIGGALFGGITGAIKSGTQREAAEQQEFERRQKLLTGLRIAPSKQETGGMVTNDTVPERPVQMEEGEVMLFEDGRLVDTMAKEKHKDMDEKEVTDIIPTAFVFSNSKKRLINLAEIKDDVFTYTRGNYSENGNTPMEKITMGDVYGTKGKVTPAEMAKKVRKDTPIIEKPVEDIERRTNEENLRRRAERLAPIMKMQEGLYKKFEFESPEKFELGGITCPPGYTKDNEGRCFTTNPDTGEVEYFGGVLDEVTVTGEGRDQFNPAMPVKPLPTGTDSFNDALGGIGAYRKAKNPVVTPLPQKPITGVSKSPTTPSTTPSGYSGNLFAPYEKKLNENDSRVEQDYLEAVGNAEELYQRQRLNNLGVLGTRLAGISMQNPNVTPVTQGTEFINEMFPKISESEIQAQVQPARNNQNRVLNMINESGTPGTQIGSAIASTQAKLIEGENQVRGGALAKNKSQDAARFATLNKITNFNRASDTQAENATRDNKNRMTSNVARAGGEFLNAQSGVNQSLNAHLVDLKRLRQESRDVNEQKKLDLAIRKIEAGMKKDQIDLDRKYIESGIDNLLQAFVLK